MQRQTIQKWLDYRVRELGLSPIVDPHHRCQIRACKFDTIDIKQNIYGCLTSGVTHVCEPQKRRCEHTFISNSWDYTCIFSGATNERYIEESLFGKDSHQMKGKMIDFEHDMTDITIDHAFDDYGEDDEVSSESNEQWLQRLLNNTETPKAVAIPVKHSKPRQLTSEIKVNSSEDLSMENVQEFFNEVRVNLEIINGSYSQRLGIRMSRQLEQRRIGLRTLSTRVDTVITDLLFNIKERTRINKELDTTSRKHAIDAVKKYYKNCLQQNIRPFLQTADDIFDHNRKETARSLLISPKLVSESHKFILKQIILKLWFVVFNVDPISRQQKRLFIKDHAIAVLHAMRTGLSLDIEQDKHVLLEVDVEVERLFPHASLLDSIESVGTEQWSYEKNDITTGRKNLINALQTLATKNPAFAKELCNQLKEHRFNSHTVY